MSNQKYFIDPFAFAGDITPSIPNAADPSGLVSYDQGFTFDYQRDLQTDPAALSPTRINFNALFNDITVNLQNYQQNGTPEFITSAQNGGFAFSYRIGAQIRYSDSGNAPFAVYLATSDNTTSVPGTDGTWQALAWSADIWTGAGTANAATVTLTPPISSLTAIVGVALKIIWPATNTAISPTLAINGLAAKTLVNSNGFPIAIGQLSGSSTIVVVYDGINFECVGGIMQPGRLVGVKHFLGSGTYTPTVGSNSILVKGVAGGGSGAGCLATGAADVTLGSGGGGGGYFEIYIISGFSSVAVVVGSGGAAPSGAAGNAGGTTSFGAFASATGGAGGAIGGNEGYTIVSPFGGANGGVATGGNVNNAGGYGQYGFYLGTPNTTSGGGGASGMGGGGAPFVTGTGDGQAAVSPGAGGSGAVQVTPSSAAKNGGAGADGMVIVYEYS